MSLHKNAEWMTQLQSTSLIDLPLTDLAIPGSHDSGTFVLDCNGCVAPGGSTEIENLAKNPLIGSMAKGIIHKWAICQSLDFTQQLLAGIRYFDLRMATKPGCEDMFCVHQLYGPKISDFTVAVDNFLQDHPHEVILIDLNHFYGFELEHHIQLATHLLSVFGSKVCHRCIPESLTLRKMWQGRKQVIIFYQFPEMAMFPELFSSDNITSPWPNTPDRNACIKFLTEKFSHKYGGFVVCQGILTPTTSTIMAGLFSSLENWTKPWTAEFTSWAASTDSCSQHFNIVIADFVQTSDFIQTIIDLNKRRIK